MRTTLFLSTLFAVTFAAGAALAEKPAASPVRVPRTVEKIRNHGDVIDKAYRGSKAAIRNGGEQMAADSGRIQPVPNPKIKGESRILCSELGIDCARPRARVEDRQQGGLEAGAVASGDRNVRIPPFMDKVLGKDRMQCNEAEECSMSTRAAKRAWARAGGEGAPAETPAAAQSQLEKIRTARSQPSDRMQCNEGGECMMSSKAAKKIWAYESVKAGTFNGPDAKTQTPAAKAIEDAKKKN